MDRDDEDDGVTARIHAIAHERFPLEDGKISYRIAGQALGRFKYNNSRAVSRDGGGEGVKGAVLVFEEKIRIARGRCRVIGVMESEGHRVVIPTTGRVYRGIAL